MYTGIPITLPHPTDEPFVTRVSPKAKPQTLDQYAQ